MHQKSTPGGCPQTVQMQRTQEILHIVNAQTLTSCSPLCPCLKASTVAATAPPAQKNYNVERLFLMCFGIMMHSSPELISNNAHLVWPSTRTSLVPRWLTAYRMLPSTCGPTRLPATLQPHEHRFVRCQAAASKAHVHVHVHRHPDDEEAWHGPPRLPPTAAARSDNSPDDKEVAQALVEDQLRRAAAV